MSLSRKMLNFETCAEQEATILQLRAVNEDLERLAGRGREERRSRAPTRDRDRREASEYDRRDRDRLRL